jgi:transcription-repair coupling factor (superfamily II helicase)
MSERRLAALVEGLDAAVERARGAPLRVSGLRGSAAALALSRVYASRPRPIVVILPDAAGAEAFAADLRFYLGAGEPAEPLARVVHHLPGWEVPPFEPLSPTRETIAARAEGLHHLSLGRAGVVVTTVEAWGQRCLPRAAFADAVTHLVAGQTVALDDLAARLIEWGHHRVPLVQDPGDLAVRGGILDVFPVGHEQPVRIEFLDDELERLRRFDPESQRSIEDLREVLLLPMREFGRSRLTSEVARMVDDRAADLGVARHERRDLTDAVREGMVLPGFELLLPYLYDAPAMLADYVPDGALVVSVGAAQIEAEVEAQWGRIEEHAAAAERDGRFHPPAASLYLDPAAWRATLEGRPRIEVEELDELAGGMSARTYSTEGLALRTVAGSDGPLAGVVRQLRTWQDEGARVVVVAGTPAHRERLSHLLSGHGLAPVSTDAPFPTALAGAGREPIALAGELGRGTRLPDDGLVVITEAELFGEPRQTRRRRRERQSDFLSTLSELQTDDYVVHVDHGIGRYRGLRHMRVADTEGDYLHLEYLGGDRLYVPADRIDVVQRYANGDAAAPALDKLGGTSWERVKAKTRESILAMAHELMAVYAQREARRRAPYPPLDEMFEEFVARFPFEETPGQQRAIDEVLGDLAGEKAMDRLVCGDVGFGKTEVALRAAFLAVLAGRQVAVLVPTTILAQQHLETFRKRFAGYPISVDMLSRFRTPAEHRATLKKLESGALDVVIGTQRLLQKDVVWKELGLLVVDEEHRFGVRDKERIRALRGVVDVLTLTATPIPRTLNMALSGIRDLSVIETPPVDRLAIRTYVTRYDESVVRDAIVRELERGGQAFFVHNRVESIERMAARLREIVPEAKTLVAHGQMPEADLEKTMLAFLNAEANLLVTSAIIESGLDIPLANTVIVNRADTFGLAQLYQIRGRVGRSHRRAYAYLTIPGEHLITSDAQKRLRVLQELDDLGGGFRLAAHDLEIRGAGNLLGKQQSGHITAVGLELYTHMMEQAVCELQGKEPDDVVEPEVQLGVPAYIPESYIPDVGQRLVVYRRLARIRGVADLEHIADELTDRFGPPPPLVGTLLRLMELRRWLKDARVLAARRRGETVVLDFDRRTPIRVERLVEHVRGTGGRLRLTGEATLVVRPEATEHDAVIRELQAHLQRLCAA